MREVLIVIAGILMVIFIMVGVALEAHFNGWMECYERMREIDDSYIESASACISGMEKQIKNYEEYTKELLNYIETLEDNHECLRLDIRDAMAEEERLNSYIDSLENQIDHLERELAEFRGEENE